MNPRTLDALDDALNLGELSRASALVDGLLETGLRTVDDVLDLGMPMAELGRADELVRFVDAAVHTDPRDPEVQFLAGLIAELGGDHARGDEHYERAHQLDSRFIRPFRVSEDRFVELAQASLDAIPAPFRDWIDNVDIRVRALPIVEHVRDGDSPIGMLVLGYFDGLPRPYRSTEAPFDGLPAHVFLFQRNIERRCSTEDQLREEIEITLLHELGHFAGLDEDDMERLGLD